MRNVFFFFAEGLKLEILTSLLPSVNQKTAKVNATYKQPNVHTVASLDVFKVSEANQSQLSRYEFAITVTVHLTKFG